MRTLTTTFGAPAVPAIELQDLSYAVGDPAQAAVEHRARRSPVSSAVRVVGVLAFVQSLVFLMIWLLICASAGARPAETPGKPGGFVPALKLSTYEPTKTRDPFGKSSLPAAPVGVIPVPNTPVVMPALQLDGILYEATNPSASVNGQLLVLNKTVRLDPTGVNIPVKAVAITRQQVTLEILGQRVELKLNPDKPPAGK